MTPDEIGEALSVLVAAEIDEDWAAFNAGTDLGVPVGARMDWTAMQVRLRARMHAAGVSENELAEDAVIPRSTLRRRLKDPGTLSLSEVERIADALRTTVPWLMFGNEAERSVEA